MSGQIPWLQSIPFLNQGIYLMTLGMHVNDTFQSQSVSDQFNWSTRGEGGITLEPQPAPLSFFHTLHCPHIDSEPQL